MSKKKKKFKLKHHLRQITYRTLGLKVRHFYIKTELDKLKKKCLITYLFYIFN